MFVNTGIKSCFNNPQASHESWSRVNKQVDLAALDAVLPGEALARRTAWAALWEGAAAPLGSAGALAAHAGSAGLMSRYRSSRTSPAAQRRVCAARSGI